MKTRIYITIIAIILYVGLFNFYIYELTRIPYRNAVLFYNYLTLSTVVYFLLDWKSGFINKWHEQLNLICILCVIVNYIIIILTHHVILTKPIPMFFAFNGGIFAVTILILINGVKHGYFKD